ncbi:hypothetical protein ABZS86_21530 [Streptomyces sp. NPDC005355]
MKRIKDWFKQYKPLLLVVAIALMVGLLKGAATAAGADIYEMLRSMYS